MCELGIITQIIWVTDKQVTSSNSGMFTLVCLVFILKMIINIFNLKNINK